MKNNKLTLLSIIWNHRNITAEKLINAKGKWVPCAYGPHTTPLYAQVCIGQINPDYNKEIITVKWEKRKCWGTRIEQVPWSNLCLSSDKKQRACKNSRRIQLAKRTN